MIKYVFERASAVVEALDNLAPKTGPFIKKNFAQVDELKTFREKFCQSSLIIASFLRAWHQEYYKIVYMREENNQY